MATDASHDALQQSHHEQLLKMVAKGFYNELIKYGIKRSEVITVAGHLLDNVMQKAAASEKPEEFYDRLFTLADILSEWPAKRRLVLGEVTISPLPTSLIPQLALWLATPQVRESFIPHYPESETGLSQYFAQPTRQYFQIAFRDEPVGIIGAENVDRESAKLEMRKLVGDQRFRGKGIGKRATFLFLYYAFMVLHMNKVYIHSDDINIRNLNINSRFGFELEGIFFEDFCNQEKLHDVVRMGLLRSRWLAIFQKTPV